MFIMIQKSSYLTVLEIFFKEPTNIHFIREISKRISLAHTSVRKNFKVLLDEGLIIGKKSKPFNGYVANRDDEKFVFYKKVYNFYSLFELVEFIKKELNPKAIVLFGSYLNGMDIENSDIDLFILSNSQKNFDLSKFEADLGREVNFINVKSLKKIDKPLRNKILNGMVLYGGVDYE